MVALALNAYAVWQLHSRIAPASKALTAEIEEVRAKRLALRKVPNFNAELDDDYARTEALLTQRRESLLHFVAWTYLVAPEPKSSPSPQK